MHATSRWRAWVALLAAVGISGMLLTVLHATFSFTLGVPHFLFHVVGSQPLVDISF